MKRFIEIVDPLDRLTDDERRVLDDVFESLPSGSPRTGLSQRALLRGYRALEKLRAVSRLKVPEPPPPADWRVWHHYRRAHWKYDALASHDSPVRSALRGRSRESRRQLAMRAVKRVDTFRLRCRRARRTWWFKIVNRLMSDHIQ